MYAGPAHNRALCEYGAIVMNDVRIPSHSAMGTRTAVSDREQCRYVTAGGLASRTLHRTLSNQTLALKLVLCLHQLVAAAMERVGAEHQPLAAQLHQAGHQAQ